MSLARKYAICCAQCYDHTPWYGTAKIARTAATGMGWRRVVKIGKACRTARRDPWVDYCPTCVKRFPGLVPAPKGEK